MNNEQRKHTIHVVLFAVFMVGIIFSVAIAMTEGEVDLITRDRSGVEDAINFLINSYGNRFAAVTTFLFFSLASFIIYKYAKK